MVGKKHVVVVVLGDAGRSPRMSYHALSLLQNGCDVTLVGYRGSALIPQLAEFAAGDGDILEDGVAIASRERRGRARAAAPRFRFVPIPMHPRTAAFNAFKPLKALFQLVTLFVVLLFRCPGAHVLLLQIPPAIPTMLVCIAVTFLRRMRLVFDWHNFGHTLMGYHGGAGKRGRVGVMQRVARAYETTLGPMADGNLCVTNAMRRVLKEEYRGTLATTFYDRPKADVFRGRTPVRAGVALLQDLVENELHQEDSPPRRPNSALVVAWLHAVMDRMRQFDRIHDGKKKGWDKPPEVSPGCKITGRSGGVTTRRGSTKREAANTDYDTHTDADVDIGRKANTLAQRAALLMVSSTSWTPDEDFSILLDAMVKYDERAASNQSLPCLVLFVTGKGPLKDYYVEKVDRLRLSYVAIRTVWLEPEDYPRLLGCADLGVSLHASSSGVDLPMKVVDMFGAQMPVAALGYPCLAEEMVEDGKNGVVFSSSDELCQKLENLLVDDWSALKRMQEYVKIRGHGSWETEWRTKAKRVILGETVP